VIVLFNSNQFYRIGNFSNRREDSFFKGDSPKNIFCWLLPLVLHERLDHIHIKNAKTPKSNGNGSIETCKEYLL